MTLLDSLLILKENISKHEIILFKDSIQSKSEIVLSKIQKEENVFHVKLYSFESSQDRDVSRTVLNSGTKGLSSGDMNEGAISAGEMKGAAGVSAGNASDNLLKASDSNQFDKSSAKKEVFTILDHCLAKLLKIKEIQKENRINVLIIYDLWNELELNPALLEILLDSLQDSVMDDLKAASHSSSADQNIPMTNDHFIDKPTKYSLVKLINILKSYCHHLVLVYHSDLAIPLMQMNISAQSTNQQELKKQKKAGSLVLHGNSFFIKQLEYLSTLHVMLSILPSGHSNDADGMITFLHRGFNLSHSSSQKTDKLSQEHSTALSKPLMNNNQSKTLNNNVVQEQRLLQYLFKTSLKGDQLSLILI